jgi:hypothetical protein
MKRSSFFAALLALSPAVIAAPSFAQPAPTPTPTPTVSGDDQFQSGTTTRMFIINAANAGALTFSGVGTANFNNSIGENNQFVVGSSTNLGVSAQLSSTPEFDAVAKANLALTGNSSLMQTNGTASQAANAQAASSAAATSALQTSLEMTDQKFGSTLDEFKTANAGTSSGGSWWGEYFGSNTSVSTITAAQYEEAKEAFKTEKYSEAYSSAINSASSSSSGNNQNGVISGNFVSTSNSASSLAQTVNQEQVFTAAAASAASSADARFGEEYNDMSEWSTSQGWANEQAWSNAKAEYQTTLTKTFSDSGQQSAQAGLTSNDTSNVTVTGLGAIATVNSKDTSAFLVDLSRLTNISQTNSTATASGSANSSLSTNSFASQSRAETASAFMQAFSAASNVTVD